MAKKSGAISMTTADSDWRVQSDLNTLIEAEAIEKDPKRLKACQELAKKKMLDMAAVAKESSSD